MVERLQEVKAELAEFLNNAAGAHAMSVAGIRLAREQTLTHLAEAIDADQHVVLGIAAPEHPDGAIAYQLWTLRSIPDRLAPDGPVALQIGHQWIVSVYTHWEDFYRNRLDAAGADDDELNVPAWGDLRHLRNDIVHHGGIATTKNAGRCAVLADWVSVGDQIRVTTDRVAQFMGTIGLGDPRDNVPGRPSVRELLGKLKS